MAHLFLNYYIIQKNMKYFFQCLCVIFVANIVVAFLWIVAPPGGDLAKQQQRGLLLLILILMLGHHSMFVFGQLLSSAWACTRAPLFVIALGILWVARGT